MKYCNRCVMPDTRPGLIIGEDGVCSACRHAEQKNTIDWNARWTELEALCDQHRGCHGDGYDCIIPVSGGKDSHFQVHVMKERLDMNPLLVCVTAPFSTTEAGDHNLANISEEFGCDVVLLSLNRRAVRTMMRKAFEELGSPTWCYDRAIYAFPLQTAVRMDIPLVVWGENTSYEYGGPLTEEMPSAIDQINNDAVKDVGGLDHWLVDGLTMKDMQPYIHPSPDEIERVGLNPIYLSYFCKWSGYRNYLFAKGRGFKSLEDTGEWDREGFVEGYDQIDSVGYLVHPQIKYMKFAHARVTDVCSNLIREGRMTRDEAIELVREHDHKLDPKALADFLAFTGYTEVEFWKIVDRFYNTELFEKVDGEWKIKNPIWEESSA